MKEIGHVDVDGANLDVRIDGLFEDGDFSIFDEAGDPKDKDLVFPMGEYFLGFGGGFGFENFLPDFDSHIDFAFGQIFVPLIDD